MGVTLLVVFIFPGPITEAGLSDFRLRTWGMTLQLIGAATVWYDLTDSARKYGKGNFLMATWEWLKAGIFGQPTLIRGSSSNCYAIGSPARIKQRRDLISNASIESRLEALEFNQSRLDQDLDSAYREIEKNTASVQMKIREEAAKQEERHKELQKDLQDAIVGNYPTLAFGAAWVAVGIIVSAWAPEIVKVVAGQWPQVWAAM